jgi:hypothetical protein
MSERTFHFIFGALLLVALYFSLSLVVYILITWQLIEAVSGRYLTDAVSRLRNGKKSADEAGCGTVVSESGFGFSAQRALRAVLAMLLLLSYVLFVNQLWIVNWFVGFALMAAGISGICPMLAALQKIGFR